MHPIGSLWREHDFLSLHSPHTQPPPPSDLLCLRSSRSKYNTSTINSLLVCSPLQPKKTIKKNRMRETAVYIYYMCVCQRPVCRCTADRRAAWTCPAWGAAAPGPTTSSSTTAPASLPCSSTHPSGTTLTPSPTPSRPRRATSSPRTLLCLRDRRQATWAPAAAQLGAGVATAAAACLGAGWCCQGCSGRRTVVGGAVA